MPAEQVVLSNDQPGWNCPQVTVENLSAPGPHGPIPLRSYRPATGRPARVLLWAHGGGFEHGGLDMLEAHRVSAELARRATAFVVSVDYRLAREGVRYPVPLDDVRAAWSWLHTEGLPTAALDDRPIALGGASVGAALALATALHTRDHAEPGPDALLLAYPWAHFPVPALDEATLTELAARPALPRISPQGIENMVRNYVGRITDLPADALPGMAPLPGLPATHILLSEYDSLRPSGELLQRQLGDAGVPVTTFLARGVPHGHLNLPEPLPQIDESLDFLAAALRDSNRSAGSASPRIVET